jgi:diguanylate cyclase (GGDEF)-like protein/PAS domain S-box-containing protein
VNTETSSAWFSHAPCGLISTTADGGIVEVNDTFLAWTGYRRSEIEGKPFSTLLDPGSQLFFETRLAQILHLHGVISEVAVTIVAADGRRLPMLVNSTLSDDDGLVRSALFNATERRRYEADLLDARREAETSEQRVRILQDVSSMFGLSASDEDVAETFVSVAREAFDAVEAGVWLIDEDSSLRLVAGVNPVEGQVRPIPTLRNAAVVTVVTTLDAEREYPELASALQAARLSSLSIMPLRADGSNVGILVCFYSRRTEFDERFFELQQAIGRQASQTLVRVRQARRLAFLALHDQLTGIANRELLQQSLDDALKSAQDRREPLAVIFLDVDDFKSINDRYGHAAGDEVLRELATRLRAGVRTGDQVGRIGGDEFVAICADADVAAAESVAARILAMMREPIDVGGHELFASVSVGISLFRPDGGTAPSGEDLLIRADRAMYESKGTGKDRFTLEARATSDAQRGAGSSCAL